MDFSQLSCSLPTGCTSRREWPLVISGIAFTGIIYHLQSPARGAMEDKPETLSYLFRRLRYITVALWFVYPVFWIFSADGFGLLSFM